jgi:hypothetical protein
VAQFFRARAWWRLDSAGASALHVARSVVSLLDAAAYTRELPDDDPYIDALSAAGCFAGGVFDPGPLGWIIVRDWQLSDESTAGPADLLAALARAAYHQPDGPGGPNGLEWPDWPDGPPWPGAWEPAQPQPQESWDSMGSWGLDRTGMAPTAIDVPRQAGRPGSDALGLPRQVGTPDQAVPGLPYQTGEPDPWALT